MKFLNRAACMALAIAMAGPTLIERARAADLASPDVIDVTKSPVDVSFGVKFASEYMLRSITQTRGKPAVQGYAEISLFDWAYAGIWGSNVDFGNGSSNPSAEIDYYGGLRHSWGPLTLDAGFLYLDFTGETPGVHEIDYWKVYGIAKYAITDQLTIGANVFWTGSYIGFDKIDGTHSALFAKYTLPNLGGMPDVGAYVSSELARQWVSDNFAPDYTFWNAGVGLTYKAMTLDFRYSDSALSRRECGLFIGRRGSCGDRYMVSLSFDTSLSKLK